MIRNYLKTAIRNLWRNKGFSLINIISLSIGISCCLMIGLFVWDELQYDKFIKGGENIYRIYNENTNISGTTSTASVPPMLATYLQSNFPEVQNTMRILMFSGKLLMEVNKNKSYENKGLIADLSFFDFFPLKFLKGNPASALEGTLSVVITEDLAKKYFGSTNPMGKVIKIEKENFLVKGVLAKVPEHFHLDFSYIMPMESAGIEDERMRSWNWSQFFTYIKVRPGTNIKQLENKFQLAVKKEVEPRSDKRASSFKPYFQRLRDIHLQSSDFVYNNAKTGNANHVKGLTLIVFFILIIACFNFVNLSTARSFRRAKEIGVRKVIGANRKQLTLQFIGETVVFALISICIAIVATYLLLPVLNDFTNKTISFSPFNNPLLGVGLLVGAVVIGIFAGIYPALFMSGFKPVRVLKGKKPVESNEGSSYLFRKGLVIMQFTLSSILIVCTIIVYRQMDLLHEKDLGFNKEQILYFDLPASVLGKTEALKEELLRSQGITSATAGYGLPGDQLAGDAVIVPERDRQKEQSVILFMVDHDYMKTLDLTLVSGRNFSKKFPNDVNDAFMINETAVRELGFKTPQNAIGKELYWEKWETRELKKGRVIGVVKDFHYKSLHEKVTSAVLQIYPEATVKMALKVKETDLPSTIAFIKLTWNKFSPDYPLAYNFLDENFAAMYDSEEKLSELLFLFTIISIFVVCLGLLGLASFAAEERIKEIGIRKVLGATAMNIMVIFSRSFLSPIFLSLLIAFPIAWYIMNNWLEDFPYRTDISWWIFLCTFIISLVITILAVSFHAIKAAFANPINTLRTE